jgi:hypothetical protein
LGVVFDHELQRLCGRCVREQLRELERHIDSARHARGGDDLSSTSDAVFDWNGAILCEQVMRREMRRRLDTVENPGDSEQERADAHRGGVARGLVRRSNPIEHRLVPNQRPRPDPSRNQEHVGMRHLVKRVVDRQASQSSAQSEVALMHASSIKSQACSQSDVSSDERTSCIPTPALDLPVRKTALTPRRSLGKSHAIPEHGSIFWIRRPISELHSALSSTGLRATAQRALAANDPERSVTK